MAIRWKVPFMSLKGDELTINIYDKAFNGTAQVLKGAASPFETSEDSDTDILAPSRVSTGYIRVIDEDNLSGIMPTDTLERPVTLTSSVGATLWQGYLQMQQLGQDMYLDLKEVEFATADALGVLGNINMDYKNHVMKMETFGELIHEAISVVNGAGLSITSVSFPKEWHDGSNYLGWARLSVNRQNWFKKNYAENEEDYDVDIYDSNTYLSMLESIAKQLGWSMAVEGSSFAFVSPQSTDYATIGLQQLKEYAQGASRYPINISQEDITLADEQHASVDNQKETVQGAKKVKVTADANSIDDLDVGIKLNGEPYVRTKIYSAPTTTKALVFRSFQTDKTLHSYQMQGSGQQASVQELGYDPERDLATPHILTNLVKADTFDVTDIEDKIKYNYKESILLDVAAEIYSPGDIEPVYSSFGPLPFAEFSGMNMPPQETGALDMDFTFVNPAITNPVDGNITVKLKVGNYYYNGSTWVTSEATFVVPMIGGNVKVTKRLDDGYSGGSHHIIPIDKAIGGDVSLTFYLSSGDLNRWMILSVAGQRGTGYALLESVSLTYCPLELSSYNAIKKSSTYTAAATKSYGQEEKEISLNMATMTPTLKSGHGILYFNGAFAIAGTPQYYSRNISTEAALLEKMKRAYFRSGETIFPIITTPCNDIPKVGNICLWNNKRYVVLSRSINWRDNIIKIQAGQKI